MLTIKKAIQYLTDTDYRFLVRDKKRKYFDMPDEEFLKRKYRALFKKELDLEEPETFSEKLQWLKLYNRRPEYTTMVDKYAVKKYVADRIGEEYVIPLLGAWDSFDEIDFDLLPERFVLKTTHDSGGLVICKSKSTFDKESAKNKLDRSLAFDYYKRGREWPYKNVPRRIIAEQYLEDSETKELRDYKFFCFNGEPKALYVATDRQSLEKEVKFDFFDMDYEHIDLVNRHHNAEIPPEKPKQFELMKRLSSTLAGDIPFVRIDFYEVNGRVLFGEMTFFHLNGLAPFEPEKWDHIFGSWLTLPSKKTTE